MARSQKGLWSPRDVITKAFYCYHYVTFVNRGTIEYVVSCTCLCVCAFKLVYGFYFIYRQIKSTIFMAEDNAIMITYKFKY